MQTRYVSKFSPDWKVNFSEVQSNRTIWNGKSTFCPQNTFDLTVYFSKKTMFIQKHSCTLHLNNFMLHLLKRTGLKMEWKILYIYLYSQTRKLKVISCKKLWNEPNLKSKYFSSSKNILGARSSTYLIYRCFDSSNFRL